MKVNVRFDPDDRERLSSSTTFRRCSTTGSSCSEKERVVSGSGSPKKVRTIDLAGADAVSGVRNDHFCSEMRS